jgi:hypothetical protein
MDAFREHALYYEEDNRQGETMAGKAKGRGRRKNRDEGSDVSDYRRKTRAAKQARGSKGSCSPKLFMLLLPFAAVGTFLVLKS